jgi:hypothetical protein
MSPALSAAVEQQMKGYSNAVDKEPPATMAEWKANKTRRFLNDSGAR